MRQQAVWAAVVLCAEVFGKASTRPVVLRDADDADEVDDVIVHLAPCPVVAKVGRHPDRAAALEREVRVARDLVATGASIAAPLHDLVVDPGTGLPVTFWEHRADLPELGLATTTTGTR